MKVLAATLAVFFSSLVFSATPAPEQQRSIDLRGPHALEDLQKSDPAGFEQVTKIIAGLREQPKRAEGDWLQVNFNATCVFRTIVTADSA